MGRHDLNRHSPHTGKLRAGACRSFRQAPARSFRTAARVGRAETRGGHDKRYSFGGPAGPRVECFGWQPAARPGLAQDASITASGPCHQNHSLDAPPPPPGHGDMLAE